MTEWRPIPSLPGFSASSDGEIRNDKTGTVRKSSSAGNSRYRIIGFGGKRDGRIARTVHSLVAEAFHGPRPRGLEVKHLDGVRSNCAAANLAYGTKAENAADRELHGNTQRGIINGNAKLTCASQPKTIRTLYAAGGVTQYELAATFGISQAQVNNIILNKQHRAE